MERRVSDKDCGDVVLVKQYQAALSVWRARWLCQTRELVVGSTEGTFAILSDACTMEPVFVGARDYITDIELVENEIILATLLNGVYKYNRDTHRVLYLEGLPFRGIHDVAIGRSRGLIAVVGDGVALGELSGAPSIVISSHEVPNPSAVVFSPDASVMAIGGGEGEDGQAKVAVVETRNCAVVCHVDLGSDALCIDRLVYSGDGRFIAAGGYQECFLIDACSHLAISKVFPMSSWVTALLFSQDSQWLYVGDDKGEIFVYNLTSGKSFRMTVEGSVHDFAACTGDYLYVISSGYHDLCSPLGSFVYVWSLDFS